MLSRQRKILCIISGTIAIGGIAYALFRMRAKVQPQPEVAEFSSKDLGEKAPAYPLPDEDVTAPEEEVLQTTERHYVFENIGATFYLPDPWKVSEDISPVPNVAMVSIHNTSYPLSDGPGQAPGSAPVLVLSVEDNSLEGLDLHEFKEKSKQTAMQQMYMMTNGMVPPRILFDGEQQTGEFELVLEYALETPMFQIRVINFIMMRDELAYSFQLMANAEVFAAEVDAVKGIVERFVSVPIPTAGGKSQAHISSVEGEYTVDLPVSWIIDSQKPEAFGDVERLLSLVTSSPVKTESVELFKSTSSSFDEAALRALAKLDKATGVHFFIGAGTNLAGRNFASLLDSQMSVLEYKNALRNPVTVVSLGAFCLRVTPQKSNRSVIRPDVLRDVMLSITTEPLVTSTRYINHRNGFSFPIKQGSRVVESRVGDNTVTFAPEGIRAELLESINSMKPNEDAFEPMPIFTVRCGDPSTDKDCEKTLEGWMVRLRAEQSRSEVKMIDLAYDTINSMRCISFSQKEMQESSPGKKDEHQAKIYVLVENEVTYMLRWEIATEGWRQFEPNMRNLLNEFSVNVRS